MRPLIVLYFTTYFFVYVFSQQLCGNGRKQCDNGQCVSTENWCDGKVHCADTSDETFAACSKQKCPRYSFRCSYGACIGNNLKCNNVPDCFDGSDEAAVVCSGLIEGDNTCSESFQVQCRDLQCIPQDKACDGKIDCTDGSDETIKTCTNLECPRYSYQCAYGACTSMTNKCDGKIDCADRSDENNEECMETNTTISTTFTTTTIEPPFGCLVPDTKLILTDSYSGKRIRPGKIAEILTSVNNSCPKNYVMDGPTTNFCNGDWVNPHPVCIKLCPPITGYTIEAQCNFNGIGVNCKKYVKPGTIAHINCAVMYKKPDRNVNENILCQSDGEWDYTAFKCEQICGTVDTTTPFSVNSDITDAKKVPWNVGIYSNRKNNRYEQICGGTIIRSKIVISAAHCFWNDAKRVIEDESKYLIIAGKYYRNYYATNESLEIQQSNISKISVFPTFNGANYDYANDLAVLILNDHIVFKNHIRPACLSYKSQSEQYLPSGKTGVVAGWGITDTGVESPELRSVILTSIDSNTCKTTKLNSRQSIAPDKFCVETSDGRNVCPGDSGGGFLINETSGHYHLWGVVSNGLNSNENNVAICDGKFITSFTNVQYYQDLIQTEIVNAYV